METYLNMVLFCHLCLFYLIFDTNDCNNRDSVSIYFIKIAYLPLFLFLFSYFLIELYTQFQFSVCPLILAWV